MSTIILELGQYVPLPKFCAILGKMFLGHFVLGHFVFWGKMSWGKMSPSRSGRFLTFLGTLGTFAKNGQKVPRVALENYILNFFGTPSIATSKMTFFHILGLHRTQSEGKDIIWGGAFNSQEITFTISFNLYSNIRSILYNSCLQW